MNTVTFIQWLTTELAKRHWGYNELARQADLSSGGVSLVMTGKQQPGYEFLVKVALALDVPIEIALQRAGRLPATYSFSDIQELEKRVAHALQGASPYALQNVLDYARWQQYRGAAPPESSLSGLDDLDPLDFRILELLRAADSGFKQAVVDTILVWLAQNKATPDSLDKSEPEM